VCVCILGGHVYFSRVYESDPGAPHPIPVTDENLFNLGIRQRLSCIHELVIVPGRLEKNKKKKKKKKKRSRAGTHHQEAKKQKLV
jgi:hypothetical protein